MHISIKRRI